MAVAPLRIHAGLVALGLLCGDALVCANGGAAMAMSLRSPAFAANASIPTKYTCEGDDVSPPLAWSDAPAGTKSFALIVDDPDAPDPKAPRDAWVHWVLYNLPADANALPEGAHAAARRGARGHQRLEARRLRRAVPADRPAPLLLQALRAGRRAARSRQRRPRRSSSRR